LGLYSFSLHDALPIFPPAAPRPGLPAADLHFNFVLLVALFAMASKPWRGEWLGRFAMAALILCAIHTIAVMFQVRSVYAVQLGRSEEHTPELPPLNHL